ncbi:DEAD/DEAH box helicase [Paludibacterium yongneupense]|uniref:DEAD/DEAH box helicase n=1 Tax=Paludibacterium yongneupense TaxID=400061 RepID=UPI0003F78596|nr:DEAD/DEAH box helicase [Paludibacterium yongneupense]
MTFASLGLTEPLLHTLAELEHSAPTPVQTAVIPALLAGRDSVASAQTGSGKTAGYLLPVLQQLAASPRTLEPNTARTLVLVPTRELAQQVCTSLDTYGRDLQARGLAVYGGVSINPQMMALRPGVDVLIATPGRLLDLIEHKALRLTGVERLVLDEADRLLDLGFSDEIERILQRLPSRRQTALFSATFPSAVRALANSLLHDPVRVDIRTDAATAPGILQRAIVVDAERRTSLLYHLVRSGNWPRALVFVATRHRCEQLVAKLNRVGIHAAALHGELSQGAREHALADFKACRLLVLVATDLAARGIDIEQLPAVVNYDLPRSAIDYTHRIGRTGRAGERGCAVSFVSASTEAHFRLIEKKQGQRIEREHIAGFEPVQAAATLAPGATEGGVKGKRKSKKDKLREAAQKSEPRTGLKIRKV